MTRWKREPVEEVYTLHAHNLRSRYLDALEESLRLHDVPSYWQGWRNCDGSWSKSLTVCAEAWSRRREQVLVTREAIHAELMGVEP